jgi:peptidoglycan glycosyltransferase
MLSTAPHRHRHRRRRAIRPGVVAAVLLLLAAGGAVAVVVMHRDSGRRAAAKRFVSAWTKGDTAAMWRALDPQARSRFPKPRFSALVRSANTAAGVRSVTAGRVGPLRGDHVAVPIVVRTKLFGVLRGTIALPVRGSGSSAGVAWDPSLRLPGLRPGEAVRRRVGAQPQRASILAADGTPLDADPLGASIAGTAGPPPTGLQRLYDAHLGGHASMRLLFGRRVVARTAAVRGKTLHTTIRPGVQRAAAKALGSKLGGVAVVRPRDGAVLALAGLAVSAPQPPGSTFKIITLSGALDAGIAKPTSTYPIRTFAVLDGTKLRNASNEACGGTLTNAFVVSCNAVFAPLGARLGARRLVAVARRFGFDERLADRIPAAKPSTISPPSKLRDSLAVGAAAIGQDRDLATPLAMANVGATIADGGRRPRLRIATLEPRRFTRVVPRRVARQVRAMMLQVVRSGTGTAAALPGVEVAGKTGTAELRPNSRNPKDADAWFVAFAPATHPKVVVAVMLVGAGFGGTAAAPVARAVLSAALNG